MIIIFTQKNLNEHSNFPSQDTCIFCVCALHNTLFWPFLLHLKEWNFSLTQGGRDWLFKDTHTANTLEIFS